MVNKAQCISFNIFNYGACCMHLFPLSGKLSLAMLGKLVKTICNCRPFFQKFSTDYGKGLVANDGKFWRLSSNMLTILGDRDQQNKTQICCIENQIEYSNSNYNIKINKQVMNFCNLMRLVNLHVAYSISSEKDTGTCECL